MKGLLLINLGSPDSTSISDVKKYLDEFLMDKRVIGKSYIFRWILVKLIILNFRPKKSAKAYMTLQNSAKTSKNLKKSANNFKIGANMISAHEGNETSAVAE